MNLQPITPYQLQKNLEELQKRYDELLKMTQQLVALLEKVEGRAGELVSNDNLE